MTAKWLSLNPNPPQIPVFYTLTTKIRKPTPVGRPIISGCDGPTERISAFVDHLIQPIAQKQASYLKDTTDFLNFIEKTKLASIDVTSLYMNIPQEKGITTVWGTPTHSYQKFKRNAKSDSTRKLVPIQWKRLPSNSWNSHGDENGRSFYYHIYSQNRKRNTQTKHHQTNFFEKIHRWHINVEHKQRQNRGFPGKSKQFSPNDQIHGWHLRNHPLRNESVKRWQIQ